MPQPHATWTTTYGKTYSTDYATRTDALARVDSLNSWLDALPTLGDMAHCANVCNIRRERDATARLATGWEESGMSLMRYE